MTWPPTPYGHRRMPQSGPEWTEGLQVLQYDQFDPSGRVEEIRFSVKNKTYISLLIRPRSRWVTGVWKNRYYSGKLSSGPVWWEGLEVKLAQKAAVFWPFLKVSFQVFFWNRFFWDIFTYTPRSRWVTGDPKHTDHSCKFGRGPTCWEGLQAKLAQKAALAH